jgi:hypothetical protein
MTAGEAIRLIAARDLAGWQGLPRCSLADVTAAFDRVSDGVGTGQIGQRRRDYILVAAAGYDEPMRVWLEDADRVVALDVEYPDVAALPDQLGEPEARRDFHWAGLDLVDGELVYASRGITVFVNPENRDVLRVAVYPAASLEAYDTLWRLALPPHRRRPLRRSPAGES